MSLKISLKAAVAAVAMFTAANAEAAILTLTWTNESGVFDVFQIDDTSAVDNSIPGYLFIPVFNSLNGYDGMFVGNAGTEGYTGLGMQNAPLPTVLADIADFFSPPFWSGTGYTLTFAPGQTYTGVFGSQISVAGAVPEPNSWAMLIAGFGLVGAVMRRKGGGSLEGFCAAKS
jgi:hypothetical protein